ncbi:glycosyltransferase family 2 protein [Synechococcus sp. GFB01]|uniref:glycosyltransferase family 2 protein n=1 Tax=Synechococcus sp. GFB01 TaxID=1662190 RepID=UPI000907F88F|nr:glycosyltransferase family 2 protein [Synechococcus sp. GFB01]
MPVFNGEYTISYALDSILEQEFTDFEIHISDNHSTDRTPEIIKEYMAKDSRIRYFRQPRNIGAYKNFEYVLSLSRGKYFMWAAADDWRSPNFLGECVKLLESHKSCVAATSFDKFIGRNQINTFTLAGSKSERLKQFIDNSFHSNALFYSLMHRELCDDFNFELLECLAGDWIFICFLAQRGDILRSPDALTIFSDNGMSYSESRYSMFRSRLAHWFYPLLNFSRFAYTLSKNDSKAARSNIEAKLFSLNHYTALDQASLETRKAHSLAKIVIIRVALKAISTRLGLYLYRRFFGFALA